MANERVLLPQFKNDLTMKVEINSGQIAVSLWINIILWGKTSLDEKSHVPLA